MKKNIIFFLLAAFLLIFFKQLSAGIIVLAELSDEQLKVHADINRDGRISIQDFEIMRRFFGQSVYPYPSVTPITISPTVQQKISCISNDDCAGSPCENGYCTRIGEGTDCIDGLVKVCQAGICNCQQVTVTSSQCPRIIQPPCTNDKLPAGCGYSAMPIPINCPEGCPIICQ